MTRRGSTPGSESLELLLDTICNTFGGIVFLAMLVCLLLTQTRPRADAETEPAGSQAALTPAELARLDVRLLSLEREIERLDAMVRRSRSAQTLFATPELAERCKAVEVMEVEADGQQATRARLLSEIAEAQAAAARARSTRATQEREIRRAEATLAAARAELSRAVSERKQLVESAVALAAASPKVVHATGRAPRERSTNKSEFGVMLKYGRLYLMKVLRNGQMEVNSEEFVVQPGSPFDTATAKPHAGLPLAEGDLASVLARRFTPFDPEAWYPCLVVYPDSFDVFPAVKAALVALGYEYRVLPSRDEVLDQGGSATVQ